MVPRVGDPTPLREDWDLSGYKESTNLSIFYLDNFLELAIVQ